MCPLDITMGKAMQYYETFLPTYMAYKDPDNTYKVSKSTKIKKSETRGYIMITQAQKIGLSSQIRPKPLQKLFLMSGRG